MLNKSKKNALRKGEKLEKQKTISPNNKKKSLQEEVEKLYKKILPKAHKRKHLQIKIKNNKMKTFLKIKHLNIAHNQKILFEIYPLTSLKIDVIFYINLNLKFF